MEKHICDICAYEYKKETGDSKSNIVPGTAWENIPQNWKCPICGAEKSLFLLIEK